MLRDSRRMAEHRVSTGGTDATERVPPRQAMRLPYNIVGVCPDICDILTRFAPFCN
jgi:hypothetical protein